MIECTLRTIYSNFANIVLLTQLPYFDNFDTDSVSGQYYNIPISHYCKKTSLNCFIGNQKNNTILIRYKMLNNRSMVQSIVFKSSDVFNGFHLLNSVTLTSFPVGHDVILVIKDRLFLSGSVSS